MVHHELQAFRLLVLPKVIVLANSIFDQNLLVASHFGRLDSRKMNLYVILVQIILRIILMCPFRPGSFTSIFSNFRKLEKVVRTPFFDVFLEISLWVLMVLVYSDNQGYYDPAGHPNSKNYYHLFQKATHKHFFRSQSFLYENYLFIEPWSE